MISCRKAARIALIWTLAFQLQAATLPQKIDSMIAASPLGRNAFWGIQIVDLTSGRTLYQQNADRFFVPASNTKLFTTALALSRLGPDYTFQTKVVADQAPDAQGRIHGSLRLVGGGDPNLSARTIPYKPGPSAGDPLAPLEELASQLAARGITRVEGDLVGDDTWYLWQPYADGWSVDDPLSDDGPAISALTLNDNTISLHVQPGNAVGDLAELTLRPSLEFYRIENRLRTVAAGAERRIRVDRIPGSRDLDLWGTIPLRDRGTDVTLGIEDPALFAAQAFRGLLERHGITIAGEVVSRHRYPHQVASVLQSPPSPPEVGVELARHESAPLLEDLRITDKVSQNLHAELALRAVGKARRNIGSFEAGREEMKSFLAEAGVDAGAYSFLDGSGLSRLNLVTPATVVRLLRYMFQSPSRTNWISLLPIGGQDGTLATRFAEAPANGKVHAKTGSLSHVSALSGYVERADGRWIAFSLLVNNYNGPAAEVRGVMDRICALIME